MATQTLTSDERSHTESEPQATPRLVYTHAPVLMAKLLSEESDGTWVVGLGTVERALPVDPAVDPALLREAYESGARVLVDSNHPPTIVGVVQTQREITIDREGNVDTELRRFVVSASESFLLKSPGAFVRGKAREIELYGDTVLTRARDLARTLSAMIKLN